ncbi:hypothetical protein AB835_08190 [Candidatus Endobugula sertula]|uniref:Uncharacterized protein n=1 Tax=Candidatus Endobugula sertula TaxID=62101 RepID=A0A1D2QPX9_9GAMM|nr:hypothetical protein AB835_08190 [Candidatus Endobugula sertula]
MLSLYALEEFPDIYTDAYLVDDDDGLLFVSLWGRDARALELLARLTVNDADSVIRTLTVNVTPRAQRLRVLDASRLSKSVAKTPKETLFGCLANVWIYDSDCVEQRNVSGRWHISRDLTSLAMAQSSDLVWRLVQQASPVPLLDAWRSTVMEFIVGENWLEHRSGYRIYGLRLSLPEEVFLTHISALVRDHTLRLD